MKKLLIALAIIASAQIGQAQVKSVADAKKAIASAEAASQDAKKATKAATWMNLGKAYVGAYDAPIGQLWVGASKQELALVMGNAKPSKTEDVVLNGQQYTKETYEDKNLYFSPSGQLEIIETTQVADKEALEKAVKAYAKAYELDSKKEKDISDALKGINGKLVQEAYNQYSLGDIKAASKYFEKAAEAAATKPYNQIDTNSLYNAGFTALATGDSLRAVKFFKDCYKAGYYSENGDLFAKLASADPANAKAYLEEGFEKFPQSQSILIGLINYYLTSGESTDRLFELLDKAKVNEPNNASLYYVEGNIRSQLKQYDKAVESYEQAAKIDPNYEYGYIGEGIMYYNLAVDVQTQAQTELDDAKYTALVADFEKDLKSCIEPFEKAYNITKDKGVKVNIAEYLKNAYYRFRDQDPKFDAAYNKYSKIVSTGEPE